MPVLSAIIFLRSSAPGDHIVIGGSPLKWQLMVAKLAIGIQLVKLPFYH
jgi:hypothetical protein